MEDSQINSAQLALLRSYPGIDMLPIGIDDPMAVDAAVRSDDIGDGLFAFLWIEMAEVGSDIIDAIDALQTAIQDIETVKAAVEALHAPL